MAEQFRRELFDQIFSDAQVIDVDFSQWDKLISIYVVADHVNVDPPARLAIFVVDFVRVGTFRVVFNHYGIPLDDVNQHFQWNIDDCNLEQTSAGFSVSLAGGETGPKLVIECEAIAVRRVANSLIDRLFPKWNAPYSGFARPSIEALGRISAGRSA